jgi:hypothetical protein
MPNQENDKIRYLIDQLDHLISRDNAQIRMEAFPASGKAANFIGNSLGYLRFGIEFLKAGVAEPPKHSIADWPVNVDLKYLLNRQPLIGLDQFTRDDSLSYDSKTAQNLSPTEQRKFRMAVGCFVLFTLLAAIGLGTSIWWLASWTFSFFSP